MAQSKFEQYLEILNNKQPRRTASAAEHQENSPLRTKQYLKSTLNGQSPSEHHMSTLKQEEREAEDRKNAQKQQQAVYDFSQAELPFSNFASVQDRERDTIATSHNAEEVRPGQPSVSEYYSLAKRQGQKQDAQFTNIQAQIDSMQSSLALLMDKFDSLDYRMGFCEASLTDQLEHNKDANRQRDNGSAQSTQNHSQSRSTSQLRAHQRLSAMKQASQERLVKENQLLVDRMNNFQIQLDRLDQKSIELRDEQMRQGIDPKPLINEQIDNLLQHIDLKFAKKSALTAGIDNLGEEIAGDINSFESQLRIEAERTQSLVEAVSNLQGDLKICQISIAKIPLPIDGNTETQNFSETLVKQLLRQGEDRKTSVEETKMLQSKIQEVKLTQKRHHEKQLKQSKHLASLEEEVRRGNHLIEKLRSSQHKITTIQTSQKFNKGEVVNKDEMMRLKERVNSAFQYLIKMHETNIDRDSIIVNALIETQLGKLNRLIVKRHTHEALKEFQEQLNEPFEPPEIMLSLKLESAWRQMASDGAHQKKASVSIGHKRARTRSNSNKKAEQERGRSRSRSNGSKSRGGTQRLSSRGAINSRNRMEHQYSQSQRQPLEPKRKTVYSRQSKAESRPRNYNTQQNDAYRDPSENDYYREQTSTEFEEPNENSSDGEGDETASYIEEIPMPPKRKRSKSRGETRQRQVSRQQQQRRQNSNQYTGNGRHNISRSSKRSVSQRSEVSRKSTRSQRVKKDYLGADRHTRYKQGSRDPGRQARRSKRQSAAQESNISSNKDLQTNPTRNEQKFPMFGYQVNSSETAGIGDIYDTTKMPGAASRSSGHTRSGKRQSQQHTHQNQKGTQQYAASNFAGEDESIIEQENKSQETSKQSLPSKKHSYNYENSIQMWGAPPATK